MFVSIAGFPCRSAGSRPDRSTRTTDSEKRRRGCASSRHHWRRFRTTRFVLIPGGLISFAPDWPRPEFTRTPGAVGVGQGGVVVHEIPGHHMNMLDEPQVQVLATEL